MPVLDPENAGGHRFDQNDDDDDGGGLTEEQIRELMGGAGGGGSSGGGGGTAVDPHVSSLTQAYYTLWGIMPPPGYVEGAKNLNVYEFIEQERKKPAFMLSKTAENEFAQYAARLAQIMGTR